MSVLDTQISGVGDLLVSTWSSNPRGGADKHLLEFERTALPQAMTLVTGRSTGILHVFGAK